MARQLGLKCKVYSWARKNYPFEDALWASMGNVGDMNLTIFDYPRNLCLLFSGFRGGSLWDKDADYIAPVRRKDPRVRASANAALRSEYSFVRPDILGLPERKTGVRSQ